MRGEKTATESRFIGSTMFRTGGSVVVNYLLYDLGLYTVLPVLPILIGRLHPATSAWVIGATLFSFNFALRGASLFISSLLHRIPVRRAMVSGLLLAGIGFALVPYVPDSAGTVGCLLVAGAGISANGLVARVYVAMTMSGSAERNTVFSAVQVAVNVSAAVGPIIAYVLFGMGLQNVMMAGVGALYGLDALFVLASVPGGLRPDSGGIREPLRLGLLRVVVRDREVRRTSIITCAGSFLYGQFFSAVSLHVAAITTVTAIRAGVFTANAVVVVVAQAFTTMLTTARLNRGISANRILAFGVLVFAVSFVVLGSGGSSVAMLFVGVVVFSLAETVFTPLVNTAFAAIPGDRPLVELFNLRQIAVTLGEATGSFAGGALFLSAEVHHLGTLYWILLAVLGGVTCSPWLARRGVRGIRSGESAKD